MNRLTCLIAVPCVLSVLFGTARADTVEVIKTHGIRHVLDISRADRRAFSLPTDVAVDHGRIYIVDSGNNRVSVFDKAGKHLFSFGNEGDADGYFRNPVGIDVDRRGRIYVADRGNQRVQIFSSQGRFISAINMKSGGDPVEPVDVAANGRKGRLYISGSNNHRIMEYSLNGRLRRTWGGNGARPGNFRYPATIAMLPDNRIAVVDVINTRIQVFEADGRFVVEVGEWGVLPGQLFRPKGVAVDKRGRFYVSDSYLNVIQVFSETGRFHAVFGRKGRPKRFETPVGIAVDEDYRLYAVEMLANRVSVYQIVDF